MTSQYPDSPITAAKRSREGIAKNVTVGMRFPSAQVVKFCDAKAMQLAKALHADGRWRVVVFGGDLRKRNNAVQLRKVRLGNSLVLAMRTQCE